MKRDCVSAAMRYGPEFETCPESIRAVIEEIAHESLTRAIWIIGSRANFRATPESDWDVLVFRDDDTARVPQRCEGIDVLRVSPSGSVLLEGGFITVSFASFCWSLIDREHAAYVGCDFSEGAPIDRPQLRAVLIYERG
jgi:hypothetical protein